MSFITDNPPTDKPTDFKPDVVPASRIIHKGILSPDFRTYYYTTSTKDYQRFDVFKIKENDGSWSEPKKAFFSSQYDEHGMSFSPDGQSLYFSSTRPTGIAGIPQTWHIWKSDRVDNKWQEPVFVDIPNMRNKLVSHPTITNSGKLFFHSSELDYSEMDIYQSQKEGERYADAKKVPIPMDVATNKCTPFIAPDGDYLIFASIRDQLDLMVTFNDGNSQWSKAREFNQNINHNGQGNPFVTADGKYLFYTVGGGQDIWKVKWVNIEAELVNK